MITADNATIEIGADVYFRVKDAIQSVTNIQDLNHSTRIICQTLLQKYIGKQNLNEIESDRVNIATSLQVHCKFSPLCLTSSLIFILCLTSEPCDM